MAPEVISKIDPTGGGDFLTLATWRAAKKGDLVARNTIEVAEVYGGGSVGCVGILQADGWVTDSTHFPWIRAATGQGHEGRFRTDRALIQENILVVDPTFWTDVGWCRFGPGIVVNVPGGGWFDTWMLPTITSVPSGQPVTFDGLIIRRTVFAAAGCISIQGATTEAELIVKNCVALHRCPGGNWTSPISVYTGKGHIKVYNSTIITGNDVAWDGPGCLGSVGVCTNWSIESENNYLHAYGGASPLIYQVGPEVIHGAKDATSTPDAADPALRNIPYTNATFTDVTEGAEDLHVSAGSSLIGKGLDLTAQGVTTDFVGLHRTSPYDIGAAKYVSPYTPRPSIFIFGL